jgi:hypothetical protein
MRRVWIGLVLVVLSGVVYFVMTVQVEGASGWVSPVEAHNEAIGLVDLDDRAYPLLAEFFARTAAGSMPFTIGEVSPGDEGWDEVAAWVESEEAQGLIALLGEASGRLILGMPMLDHEDSIWVNAMGSVGIWVVDESRVGVGETALMLNVLLPMSRTIVRAGWVLKADALAAIEAGDGERFVRDVQVWSRLALMADEPNVMIGQLVGVAQLIQINRLIGEVLAEHPELIDEEVGAQLEGVYQSVMEADVFSMNLDLEYAMFEDVLRRLVDDEGQYDAVQTLAFLPMIGDEEGGVMPKPSSAAMEWIDPDLLAGYTYYKSVGQARVDAVAMPWHEVEAVGDEDSWSDGITSTPGEIGKLMFPVLSIDGEKLDRTVSMLRTKHQEMIGVRVALAAHRHWVRHGEPAMELAGIDNDLLGFEAADGFTGGVVQYRWVDGAALVYALGADGDDDGGVGVAAPEGVEGYLISDEYLKAKWDGDMVLFPDSD